MGFSVVIPTYNSAATIQTTLDSVLAQTYCADEILIYDDGSTDETVQILKCCGSRLKIIEGRHQGVANARNALCALAKGEWVAFLDHDDVWHPRYLELQSRMIREYPYGAAFFTGHLNFYGYDRFEWATSSIDILLNVRVIKPLNFFEWYNRETGPFGSMSYCCLPRNSLVRIGNPPFRVSGVDDSYFCNVLALVGPVIYTPLKLVAYRITRKAQSANKLKALRLWIEVFEILQDRFINQPNKSLYKAFRSAHASKRRQLAKRFMGAGRWSEARWELWRSLDNSKNAISLLKSLILLVMTFMPYKLQPKWPSEYREML